MNRLLLPLCVAAALACDLQWSHANQPPVREHHVHRDVLARDESVVGRAAVDGRYLLLTSGRRLVEISRRGSVSHRALSLNDMELWSLGVAADGTLWALAGRDMLVEVVTSGTPRRIALDGAYAGVHTGPGFLLFQPYDFRVGSAALLRGEPAAVGGPAGRLKVAGGNGRRVAVWMKSLVQCGFASNDRLPCWPAGAAVVDVIGADGVGRLVPLGDLAPAIEMSGEDFAERGRPVLQDVAFGEGGALWVLASAPGAPAAKERGVRDLWKYSMTGERLERYGLAAPARMLLPAGPGRLFAISGAGHLVRLDVR